MEACSIVFKLTSNPEVTLLTWATIIIIDQISFLILNTTNLLFKIWRGPNLTPPPRNQVYVAVSSATPNLSIDLTRYLKAPLVQSFHLFLVSADSFVVYLETCLVWIDIKSICVYLFGNEHDHRRETSRHVLYIHLWRPFLVLLFLYCFSQVEYQQLFRYNALIQFCDTLQQWRLP